MSSKKQTVMQSGKEENYFFTKTKLVLYFCWKSQCSWKELKFGLFEYFVPIILRLHTHVYTPSLWPSNPNPNIIPRPVIFISAKTKHTHKQALIFSRYYTYPDILTSNGRKQHFSVQKCHDRINSHASHVLSLQYSHKYAWIVSQCKANDVSWGWSRNTYWKYTIYDFFLINIRRILIVDIVHSSKGCYDIFVYFINNDPRWPAVSGVT